MAEAGRIIGFIEAITAQGIVGWALRPGDRRPLQLALNVDGVESEALFACDGPRMDVWGARADLHPVCGHGPLLGFVAPIPPGCFDGRAHRFDIVTLDGAAAGLVAIGRPLEWVPSFSFARHEVVARARMGEGGREVHGWVVVVDRMTGAHRVRNEVAVEIGRAHV